MYSQNLVECIAEVKQTHSVKHDSHMVCGIWGPTVKLAVSLAVRLMLHLEKLCNRLLQWSMEVQDGALLTCMLIENLLTKCIFL